MSDQTDVCMVPGCGQPAEVCAHGILNREVYDHPMCEHHWNIKKLDQFKAEDKRFFKPKEARRGSEVRAVG